MKKLFILSIAFIFTFIGLVNLSFPQDYSLHRRIISGDNNSEKLRIFYTWYNPVVADYNDVEVYKFNNYLNAWEPIDINFQEVLSGAYKFKFINRTGITVEGYVPPNLGGVQFENVNSLENLLLFSDNPGSDMNIIKRKIREYLRQHKLKLDESSLTVYLCLNTEGYELLDKDYRDYIYPDRLVAVIPTKVNGKLDVANMSYGDKGMSLLWPLPHFIIIRP